MSEIPLELKKMFLSFFFFKWLDGVSGHLLSTIANNQFAMTPWAHN